MPNGNKTEDDKSPPESFVKSFNRRATDTNQVPIPKASLEIPFNRLSIAWKWGDTLACMNGVLSKTT
jgi:hypothetical protein